MAVICDNTGECLADRLRPGTAGANDADDHIALLPRAIAQIPAPWRHNLLITIDGAGATHKVLNWITSLNREPDGDDAGMRVEYSVGWPVDAHTRRAIAQLPVDARTRMLAATGCPASRPPWMPSPARTPSVRSPTSPTCCPTFTPGRPVSRCSPAGSNRSATPPRNPCPAPGNSNPTCKPTRPVGATKQVTTCGPTSSASSR